MDTEVPVMSLEEKKQKTFNVYTTKLAHSDFKQKQLSAVRVDDLAAAASGGMQGLVEYAIGDKKRATRPASAGSTRVVSGSKSLQTLRSPAEISSKTRLGLLTVSKTNKSGNLSSGIMNSVGNSTGVGGGVGRNDVKGKSSAFALLEDLHKLNPAVLF
jgi:hypothetical protein